MKKFNVAAYVRLSREDGDKEESYSVTNQKQLLNHFIQSQSDFKLIDFYVDDGYTGTNFKRPAFNRMIEDAQSEKIDCIIVKDLSRFGRDYLGTGYYLERLFPSIGIRFISISDNIDSFQRSYDMMLPIKNIFNEQYSRDISQKITSAIRMKQKSGQFIGSFPSYGYLKDPNNKNHLIIDKEAAEIVSLIFQLTIEGKKNPEIAKILTDRGIPTPTMRKKQLYPNYNNSHQIPENNRWEYGTVWRILNNQVYLGSTIQQTRTKRLRGKREIIPPTERIIVKHTHEAIIDEELWNNAQKIIKTRTSSSSIKAISNRNIFSGIVCCGDCEHRLVYKWYYTSKGDYRDMYVCSGHNRYGKNFCSSHSIPVKTLIQIICKDLKTISSRIKDFKKIISSANYELQHQQNILPTQVTSLEKQLKILENKKEKIYIDYLDNLISRDEYIIFKNKILEQITTLKEQILQIESNEQYKKIPDILDAKWVKTVLFLNDHTQLSRQIILEIVSKIIVYENGQIEIFYNFENDLNILFPDTQSNF